MSTTSTVSSTPYEKFIQWSAGPIAIIAGWLATQITDHVGSLGVGHDQLAHAILASVTFLVGAGVTYAAHHKALDSLQKRWIPTLESVTSEIDPALGGQDPAAVLAEIDHVDAALTKLLNDPGTPPQEIKAGLAPTPVPA